MDPRTAARGAPLEILRNIPVESVNSVSGEDCSLTPWGIIPERQETRAISLVLAAPDQLSWNLCPKTAVTSKFRWRVNPFAAAKRSESRPGRTFTADSVQVEPLTPTVIVSGAKQSRAAERSIGRDCFGAQDAPRNDGVPIWSKSAPSEGRTLFSAGIWALEVVAVHGIAECGLRADRQDRGPRTPAARRGTPPR
jgi:hypothetical protein